MLRTWWIRLLGGARCEACGRRMLRVLTCRAEFRDGVSFYGSDAPPDADWYVEIAELLPYRCRDCGVVKGGLHHPGCCIAACMVHDWEQRLACDAEHPRVVPQ